MNGGRQILISACDVAGGFEAKSGSAEFSPLMLVELPSSPILLGNGVVAVLAASGEVFRSGDGPFLKNLVTSGGRRGFSFRCSALSKKLVGGAPILKGLGPMAARLADCFVLNAISSPNVSSAADRLVDFRRRSRSLLMRSRTSLLVVSALGDPRLLRSISKESFRIASGESGAGPGLEAGLCS